MRPIDDFGRRSVLGLLRNFTPKLHYGQSAIDAGVI
ncbi:hypothetical protein ATW7_12663 [Alteromonadales bacterium TW-7]|nr:hypothetical protein ATW7_12663 [Alteromonadales bacterium TW-7]